MTHRLRHLRAVIQKKEIRKAAAALAAAALLVAGVWGGMWLLERETSPGEPLPEMMLSTFSGDTVDLADAETPVRIYVMWASWCPLCTDTLRAAIAVGQERPSEVTVFAVNRKERREEAEQYLMAVDLASSVTILADSDDEFFSEAGGYAMPEVLLVDEDNIIRAHYRGPVDIDTMKNHVAELLQ